MFAIRLACVSSVSAGQAELEESSNVLQVMSIKYAYTGGGIGGFDRFTGLID